MKNYKLIFVKIPYQLWCSSITIFKAKQRNTEDKK